MFRKFGWAVLATIAVVVLLSNLPKGSDEPKPSTTPSEQTTLRNPLDCADAAAPANAALVGTISFKAGSTHVTGDGSIKVSPTGTANTWQARGDKGIDLTIYPVKLDPSQDKKNESKLPTSLTGFSNNSSKRVTIVGPDECTLTLAGSEGKTGTGHKAFQGEGTVKVFANP